MGGLAAKLAEERGKRFVGRDHEIERYERSLAECCGETPDARVLFVVGPGGIGKTTLLQRFRSIATERGLQTISLDGRHLSATPASFLGSLREALGLESGEDPLEVLGRHEGGLVLTIDTFERIPALEAWLRSTFLLRMPTGVVVVIAGREHLSEEWRRDAGWSAITEVLPLRYLSQEETLSLLGQRAIPAEDQSSVFHFTHGHPLAVSLVCDAFDQRPDLRFKPENVLDVVQAVLDQFLIDVPGPLHRAALEASSVVRTVTQPLLEAMLEIEGGSELVAWLSSLSFIEIGPSGLYPHDVVRETLVSELRWRNPERYDDLADAARSHYQQRFFDGTGAGQDAVLVDWIFLLRNNPLFRQNFDWSFEDTYFADEWTPSAWPEIEAMLEQHDRKEAAPWVRAWIDRQPEAMVLIRDARAAEICGFLLVADLCGEGAADLKDDPGAAGSFRLLEQPGSLRRNENALLLRYWLSREHGRDVSPIQTFVAAHFVRITVNRPRLRYVFVQLQHPDIWGGAIESFGYHRVDGDYMEDGDPFGVFSQDQRVISVAQGFDKTAEMSRTLPDNAPPPSSEPVLVLSEEEFADGVKDALKSYGAPAELEDNPLVRSGFVVDRAEAGDDRAARAKILQSILRTACEELRATPRDEKRYRALLRTYLEPAPTQEAAAELLDIPFGTYRYRLNQGIDRVVRALWELELKNDSGGA